MTRLRWRQDDRKHRCELVAHQGKSHGMNPHITVRRVETAADRKAFVELAFRLNAGDPNWVPPLKQDVYGLITPGENPWFGHAEAQFFLAERDGRVGGRISPHLDHLARSEEHTSELQSLMPISYAAYCLDKKNNREQCDNPAN